MSHYIAPLGSKCFCKIYPRGISEAVYFCKGWENARGCKLEHAVAEAYGLTIIYEEDD